MSSDAVADHHRALMRWFGPKCPLSPDEWDWQCAAIQWLNREYADLGQGSLRQIATPDCDIFPDAQRTGHDRADELLGQIMTYCGIGDWPVQLLPMPPRPGPDIVNAVTAIQRGQFAAGTFQMRQANDGSHYAEIFYRPEDLDDEARLVATLAHEVAHYVLSDARTPFPGGDDVHEILTDLTAVWLGFGIFLGNGARYSHAIFAEAGVWTHSGSAGYLSERALMTALAFTEMLAGRDPDLAMPYLKPHLASDVRLAKRYLARDGAAAHLSRVDLSDYVAGYAT